MVDRPGWVDLCPWVQLGDGGRADRRRARCVIWGSRRWSPNRSRAYSFACGELRLLALECPGVAAAFGEDQSAEISVEVFTACNRGTGAVLEVVPIPAMLRDLMQNRGLYPSLEEQGLLERGTAADDQASDKSGGCCVAFSEPSASLSYWRANSSNLALMARVVTPSATWRARAAFRR